MYDLRIKSIGITAVLSTVFALGCVSLAFAQEGSAPPPPPPSGGGDFGGSQPPPPPPPQGGGYQPFGGQQYQPPSGSQYQQPPMMKGEMTGGEQRGQQKMYGGGQQGGYQQRPPMPPQGGMMRGGQEQGMYNQKGSPQEMMRGKQEMMRDGSKDDELQQFGRNQDSRKNGSGKGGFGEESGNYGGEDESDFEDQQAEREQQMQKQQLTEMKRNLRGIEQGLKMIKQMTDKLAKQKVAVPEEYTTLVSDLTAALTVVKNATEMSDEVQMAMETIMEKGEELRDAGPRLGMLAQWPTTLKQAQVQVKRMDTQLARAKKNKTAVAYPALIAKVEASVGAVKSALEQAKSEAVGGDLETAMETLRDGVFEGSQDAYESMNVLENMANMARMVKQAEKEIARYEKEATRYEKQKKNVSALRSIIAQMKHRLEEVKAVLSSGDSDPEGLFQDMSGAENLRNDAEDELQHLRGKPSSSEQQIQSSAATNAGAAIGKSLQGLKK